MLMEFQIVALDRHTKSGELNRDSNTPLLDNWISNGNTDINKQ
jgi:hypothetical protein